MSTIDDLFAAGRPKSRQLYEQAATTFPAGVTHDTRHLEPFPIYVTHARGPRKWDVDGNEYIDYVSGHGSLLLGHSHPAVVEAVQQQMAKGTHFGACHELELAWGQLVKSLIPSAERVRFTSSGTEAGMMAVRLARAYNGRRKIVKFQGHFHGWSDQMMPAVNPPWDAPSSVGLLDETIATTVVLPANDLPLLERTLAGDRDISAVVLEADGASMGTVPLAPGFLQGVRRLTEHYGALMILDEVVSGFRYSPGGVQAVVGVKPDLTMLAKILAGGLPGGAVAGRADVLAPLEYKKEPGHQRMYHPGTFNANPISAAAGVAALRIVGTGEPHKTANASAGQLRKRLNEAIDERQASACVYGETSIIHTYIGPCERIGSCDRSLCTNDPARLKGMRAISGGLRRALLANGVDFIGAMALVSATHGPREVEETALAFAKTLDLLLAEGLAKRR
ncbi:MAG: aminotransferase class III-fold pyridoxal phosphate-dependent enzyme [Chloroflexi bacterium]|nr:aminotransferase class III-fold pyridoxal phosphate-dependent enzyme [Chloroflexota bacterium]